jgi:pimeloyl-ACP methyl ester carboxylesterase
MFESFTADDKRLLLCWLPTGWLTGAADGAALPIELSCPLVPARTAPTVLLVHGASASSNTFKHPHGGLVGFLEEQGCNVYTLDWRSSMRTVPLLMADSSRVALRRPGLFTLDASTEDLQLGLSFVVQDVNERGTEGPELSEKDVRIVGHCIGGALVAQAVTEERCRTERIVLTTLGLFFKVGVEGWIKGNDSVLDELLTNAENQQNVISAGAATAARLKWPDSLEDRFRFWLETGLHHGCARPFCERIAFMYGMPFRVDDMMDLHDSEGGLESQFGEMALATYAHCLRNLKRGWAAPFDASLAAQDRYVSQSSRKKFAGRRVTLITGNENQVWHRNSIDLMSEWLGNGPNIPGLTIKKHVLTKYGHQDLYWSSKARKEVYPLIAGGLGVEVKAR